MLLPWYLLGQSDITLVQKTDSLLQQEAYNEVIELISQNKNTNKASLFKNLAIAFENLNKEDSAFFYYKKALEKYKKNNDLKNEANTNLEIFLLLDSQKKLDSFSSQYFDDFYNYAIQSNSQNMLAKAYNTIGIKSFSDADSEKPKQFFFKSLRIYESIDSIEKQINLLSNISVVYTIKEAKYDSARYYLNKALLLAQSKNLEIGNNTFFDLYNNIGNTFKKEGNYAQAIDYFNKARKAPIKLYPLKSLQLVYSNLEQSHKKTNALDSAYFYLKKIDSLKDEIEISKQNTIISEIQEKYDNEKLRADNLVIQSQRNTNRNLLIGALILLAFGTITALLLQRNTKRKQRIAEQEKEIEIRKTEKLLKEQELSTIDAMIEGQEKERQRLASDLHDSVGATLAAAKLQFDHLAKNKNSLATQDEILLKTGTLLEDAYQEVRNMAHLKNSGVIAKKGLLPALEKLANNASTTGSLQITVEDFGLEKRLENSLEITLFRIIQELITNIIKHAKATEASITLTQHEDEINIIVEDNGVGFTAMPFNNKNGMGLNSIEKRIEHLEGTMEIDSTQNRGTSIIIDIPL